MARRIWGYTLAETLTVISILVLLAAIVFAITAPVRERARQTQCISNLKQIGVALQMYRQDWGGIEPVPNGLPLPYHRLGLPEGHMWTKALQLPRSVWFCPSRWCDPYYKHTYERHASSYLFLALSDQEVESLNRDRDTFAAYRPFGEILSEDPSFPLIVCAYHDRYRHAIGSDRRAFQSKGRVLGLSLQGDVRWYDYATLKKRRHIDLSEAATQEMRR